MTIFLALSLFFFIIYFTQTFSKSMGIEKIYSFAFINTFSYLILFIPVLIGLSLQVSSVLLITLMLSYFFIERGSFKEWLGQLRYWAFKDSAIYLVVIILPLVILIPILGLRFWDEYNFALFAKNLWYSNGLLLKTPVYQIEYFQMGTFFWGFFNSFSKVFSSWGGGILSFFFLVSSLYLLLKDKFLVLVATLLSMICFDRVYFITAYGDGIIACTFSIFVYSLLKEDKKYKHLGIFFTTLLVCFSKPVGYPLCFLGFIGCTLTELLVKKGGFFNSKNISDKFKIALCIVLAIMISKLFSQQWVKLNNSSFVFNFSLAALEKLWSPFSLQIFTTMVKKYFLNMIYGGSTRQLIIPIMGIFTLRYLLKNKKDVKPILTYFLIFLGYFLILWIAYVTTFGRYEAVRVTSIHRYMGHIHLLGLIIILNSSKEGLKRFFLEGGLKRKGIGIFLCLLFLFDTVKYRRLIPKQTNDFSNYIDKLHLQGKLGTKEKVLLVNQGEGGHLTKLVDYSLFPTDFLNTFWSFGPRKNSKDVSTLESIKTESDWLEFLKKHKITKVLIYKKNEYFEKYLWPKSLPKIGTLPQLIDVSLKK